MNTKPTVILSSILATLVLLASTTPAVAAPGGELYPVIEHTSALQAKSRAQVMEELARATAAGEIAGGEVGYAFGTRAEQDASRNMALRKSRAEVVAELQQALNEGALSASAEVGQAQPQQLAGSPRSRADVRAEAIQSARSSQVSGTTARTN